MPALMCADCDLDHCPSDASSSLAGSAVLRVAARNDWRPMAFAPVDMSAGEASMGNDASDVRKGQGSTQIDKTAFAARFRHRFYDPAFDAVQPEIGRLIDLAWDA